MTPKRRGGGRGRGRGQGRAHGGGKGGSGRSSIVLTGPQRFNGAVSRLAGPCVRVMDGERYYTAFTMAGETFRVGDSVFLEAGLAANMPKRRRRRYLAEIESLWEDCYQEKWMEGRW